MAVVWETHSHGYDRFGKQPPWNRVAWYTLSDKNSADKSAENYAGCRKFCPPKIFVCRKFVCRNILSAWILSQQNLDNKWFCCFPTTSSLVERGWFSYSLQTLQTQSSCSSNVLKHNKTYYELKSGSRYFYYFYSLYFLFVLSSIKKIENLSSFQ